jgi:hypothetical protein
LYARYIYSNIVQEPLSGTTPPNFTLTASNLRPFAESLQKTLDPANIKRWDGFVVDLSPWEWEKGRALLENIAPTGEAQTDAKPTIPASEK